MDMFDFSSDDSDENTPLIIKIFEYFVERLEDEFLDDVLTDAACMATAEYIFKPPDDELELYSSFVMYRVEEFFGEEIY